MPNDRPDFIAPAARWEETTVRYNGISMKMWRSDAKPEKIVGWVRNPRVDMIVRRWRLHGHISDAVHPDEDQMLDLMLDDDGLHAEQNQTFSLEKLGEDIKLNGVREALIITWEGKLLDGNRRKFATKWALSERGGANVAERDMLRNIPVLVLDEKAPDEHEDAILIQENYAESLKKPWPEVVTNSRLYTRYMEISASVSGLDDLTIRRKLQDEFPRFSVTEIRNRIGTWQLTQEFRVDYVEDMGESEVERHINNNFQYFRQAHDTFRASNEYTDPEFKDLLFKGIRHDLFPSFAGVRSLSDIQNSDRAKEIFLSGVGAGTAQRSQNFRQARDEAGRDRAERDLPTEQRIKNLIDYLDSITSSQLSNISEEVVENLKSALNRVMRQSAAS